MKYIKTYEDYIPVKNVIPLEQHKTKVFAPIKNNLEQPFKVKKNIDDAIKYLQKRLSSLKSRIPSENDPVKRLNMNDLMNKQIKELSELQTKKVKQTAYLKTITESNESNHLLVYNFINYIVNFMKEYSGYEISYNTSGIIFCTIKNLNYGLFKYAYYKNDDHIYKNDDHISFTVYNPNNHLSNKIITAVNFISDVLKNYEDTIQSYKISDIQNITEEITIDKCNLYELINAYDV